MSVICFHFLVNTPNDMCCSMCFKSVDAFLEEMIIRRELADNFCFYQPHYDSIHGAWDWAKTTLMDHAADKREHIYKWVEMLYLRLLVLFNSFIREAHWVILYFGRRRDELENAKSADPVSPRFLSNSLLVFFLKILNIIAIYLFHSWVYFSLEFTYLSMLWWAAKLTSLVIE